MQQGHITGEIKEHFPAERIADPDNCTPRLFLSRLWVNHQPVEPGDRSGLLDKALPFVRQLDLQHDQNNLVIEFALPDFEEQRCRTGGDRNRSGTHQEHRGLSPRAYLGGECAGEWQCVHRSVAPGSRRVPE